MHFRFTIRDLLWLTALVALAVGWWVDRNNVARHAAESYAKLEKSASVKNYRKLLEEYQDTKLLLLKERAQNAIDKMHTSAKNDGKSDPQDDPPTQ